MTSDGKTDQIVLLKKERSTKTLPDYVIPPYPQGSAFTDWLMSGYHEKSFSIDEIDIAQEERKVSNLLQDPSDPEISGPPD